MKASSYYYIFNKEDVIGSFVNLTTDRFVADYTKKLKLLRSELMTTKIQWLRPIPDQKT